MHAHMPTHRARYDLRMTASVEFTIAYEEPDEDGWIVAQVLEVPGALSQGRTREEARVNVLDALATALTPDSEPSDESMRANIEHLLFVAARHAARRCVDRDVKRR